MKKKSGTCHISIRPSKTDGIYGADLCPWGERPNSCFCISMEGVQTAEINHLQGLPRLRTTKSVNDAVALVNKSLEAEQRAFM